MPDGDNAPTDPALPLADAAARATAAATAAAEAAAEAERRAEIEAEARRKREISDLLAELRAMPPVTPLDTVDEPDAAPDTDEAPGTEQAPDPNPAPGTDPASDADQAPNMGPATDSAIAGTPADSAAIDAPTIDAPARIDAPAIDASAQDTWDDDAPDNSTWDDEPDNSTSDDDALDDVEPESGTPDPTGLLSPTDLPSTTELPNTTDPSDTPVLATMVNSSATVNSPDVRSASVVAPATDPDGLTGLTASGHVDAESHAQDFADEGDELDDLDPEIRETEFGDDTGHTDDDTDTDTEDEDEVVNDREAGDEEAGDDFGTSAEDDDPIPVAAAAAATTEPSPTPPETELDSATTEPEATEPATVQPAATAPTATTDPITKDSATTDSATTGSATGGSRQAAAEADPEQLLAAYPWKFDPETLRELVDEPDQLRAVRDRLTTKLDEADRDAVRARLLSLRAVVSRVLGDLDEALVDGREAVQYAQATGELRRTAITQARLAHVLRHRGEFAEADRLFTEANSVELPDRLRATMHEHAGRSSYDQGRHIEACLHFERALDLRKGDDPGLVARIEMALDAVHSRVRATGWGPYPRSREELLLEHRPPEPTYDEQEQCWGYVDPDGIHTLAPRYVEAQPFQEGAGWVRRPESAAWELIDESGGLLIEASAGYLGVSPFAEGLAWVSRDGAGGWFAIDRRNRVAVPGWFDEVSPFRRGLAMVRRGGCGAVDRNGRFVVPPRYRAFVTALTDGRPVEGFSDEGLAVVDAGDRLGVVDRRGQLLVAPVHARLVIHPVAFLIGDRSGRWGALDRRGDPLIDVEYASRREVMAEIDRLLADTEPVL